jgi:carboxyl-terminal processing protease
MKRGVVFLVLLSLGLLVGCAGVLAPVEEGAVLAADMSPEAAAYLEEALSIMEANSLNRKSVRWDRLREEAYAAAAGAQTAAGTYDAIRAALVMLKDNYTFFSTPEEVSDREAGTMARRGAAPKGFLTADRLGYIKVPAFTGAGQQAEEFAAALQALVREVDRQAPCGWIIDLRENVGGNGWPMLVGIGPVLGEGISGGWEDADGERVFWGYADGQAKLGGEVVLTLAEDAYVLSSPSPPVAVLTSKRTLGSSEAITIAFRGRPDTRSFGAETFGLSLSTVDQSFLLSDGAAINLTTATIIDRNGLRYGGPVSPDVRVGPYDDKSVLRTATEWLLAQPACRR